MGMTEAQCMALSEVVHEMLCLCQMQGFVIAEVKTYILCIEGWRYCGGEKKHCGVGGQSRGRRIVHCGGGGVQRA